MPKVEAIANFFIDKAFTENIEISPMKVIKLTYIAHGWYLALSEDINLLFNDDVQAWKFGPVIQSLYHSLKKYGSGSIKSKITILTHNSSSIYDIEIIEETPQIEDDEIKKLLEAIWKEYGSMSALMLSTITHFEGTPWYTTWNRLGGKHEDCKVIPIDIIKEYYVKKMS